MRAHQSALAIEVKVDSAAHIHERLDAAVEMARQKAIKHGLVVAQHG